MCKDHGANLGCLAIAVVAIAKPRSPHLRRGSIRAALAEQKMILLDPACLGPPVCAYPHT
jgi:hypothetical protein